MRQFVRLSHILNQDTPSYGNRDKVIIRVNSCICGGGTANSSCLVLSNNHIGTHIDVPRHFSDSGKKTTDYPIGEYVFEKVQVIDLHCDGPKLIEGIDLVGLRSDIDLLLIRTGYESKRGEEAYWNNNPGLSPDLADNLRKRCPNLRCVGFDFISVTSWQHREEGRLAHIAFLSPENGRKEIWVIEDMSLANAPEEIKNVVVAPLLVEDGNGTAVTVIAEY